MMYRCTMKSSFQILSYFTLFRKKTGSFSKEIRNAKEIFQDMDKDHDGKIDFGEFSALMTDTHGRPSWFFKAAAVSDQMETEGF